jgi:hypothetical protein
VYQGSVEAVVSLLLAMGIGFWADVLRIWRLRGLVEAQSADAGGQTKR